MRALIRWIILWVALGSAPVVARSSAADGPILVIADFTNSPERAPVFRDRLEGRLNDFSTEINNRLGRPGSYPEFLVRSRSEVPRCDPWTRCAVAQLQASYDETFLRGSIAIRSASPLAIVATHGTDFRPVHAVMSAPPPHRLIMYEVLIQYGELARAFEESKRSRFDAIAWWLEHHSIPEARRHPARYISFQCLDQMLDNMASMRTHFNNRRPPPSAVPLYKRLGCPGTHG